jgi:trans-aconitate 2-methyltransferase
VFSNAALHWIDDHDGLFSRLVAALRSQGQLAVQMPMNFDHPSSSIAAELATEAEYASELAGRVRGAHVDAPEVYAERLYALGIEDIDVHVRVFLHELEGAEDVLEWTRGSTLTWYRRQLGDALFAAFEAEYTRRVLDALPKAKPYLFTFNRLFIYGRRP